MHNAWDVGSKSMMKIIHCPRDPAVERANQWKSSTDSLHIGKQKSDW
jgi:hypothetical protein